MEDDIQYLKDNGATSICRVKKLIDGKLTCTSFEFTFWIKDAPELFRALPTSKEHKYDIYRSKSKEVIIRNSKITTIPKKLSKLSKIIIFH